MGASSNLEEALRLLGEAAVYVKGARYLRVRVAITRSLDSAEEIAAGLRELGYNPVVERCAAHYYVYITRMEEVREVIEKYLSLERLGPNARRIYEEYYTDMDAKGLRYRLSSVLRNSDRRPILYYVLGVLVGHGIRSGRYKVAVKVRERRVVEKVDKALRSLGLRPSYHSYGYREFMYVSSAQLRELYEEILENPSTIVELSEMEFWKFLEGLYETSGSLRLVRGRRTRRSYFEVRIKIVRHSEILRAVSEKLALLGVRASLRGTTLTVKETESIYKLFRNMDPVVKNPKTGVLSEKHVKHLLRRGVDPEALSSVWRQRWREYEDALAR